MVGAVVLALLLGVLAMAEPHGARGTQPFRIARPSVPAPVRADFRFAVLGVMATWSVLGVYLSLFPSFAGQSTHIHSLVFGGVGGGRDGRCRGRQPVVRRRLAARQAAVVGDFGTAAALLLSVVALDSGHASLVVMAAVLMGLTFGLAFGGSLRHLGQVVPAGHRGEVMSAYYVLAYSAMAVPTILAGWAATEWGLAAVFPWFSLLTALACLTAGALGVRSARPGAGRLSRGERQWTSPRSSCSWWVTGSTWNVAWWTSKWSATHLLSSSRVAPTPRSARHASVTVTCADSDGMPLVIVQACRSWTSVTPGTPIRCARTSSRSSPFGAISSSTTVASRASANALGRISTAINSVAIESARVKPVVQMTMPATTASSDPSRSASDLVERTAHVERAVLGAGQHRHGDAVGDQADRRERDHRAGVDVLG